MSITAPSKGAFYAWRAMVGKRESTDTSVLQDPLVREAWNEGYTRGFRDRLSLETEFAGAIDVNRRVADLLERLIIERDAMTIVAEDNEGKGE